MFTYWTSVQYIRYLQYFTYRYFSVLYGSVPTACIDMSVQDGPLSTQLLFHCFSLLVLILLLSNPAQLYRASPSSPTSPQSTSHRIFGGTAPWQLRGRFETRHLNELLFAAPGL
jgi:hypothetical protein